jgi:sulfur carrier protein ThiS
VRPSQLLVVGLLFGNDGNGSVVFLDQLASPAYIEKGSLDLALGSRPEMRSIRDHGYFHYDGSLTAGSCAENLIWAVSKYIAPSNEKEVCGFTASGIFETARVVQPLNGRIVESSKWANPGLVQEDLITVVVVVGVGGMVLLVLLGCAIAKYVKSPSRTTIKA